MSRFSYITSFVIVLIALCENGRASEEFLAHNNYDYNVHLWIWPKQSGRWQDPKPFIQKNNSSPVTLVYDGRHYLMVKDDKGRERHMGWYDMNEVLAQANPKEVFLGLETTMREESYTANRTETRTRTYTVNVPEQRTRTIIVNGQPQEQTYTVMVPQQRTQNYTVNVPQTLTRTVVDGQAPVLQIRSNGNIKNVRGTFGRRSLGVDVHKCRVGIHIDAVHANSAARNCWTKDGTVHSIAPGDHILAVNGKEPATVVAFKEMIQSSSGEIALRVQVQEGPTIRELWTQPR